MIYGLDGLRAIAFLLVFFFHTDYLEFGWVGVQLFFVLSGFLITGILIKMKQNLSPGDYFVKFYGRRLLRIFPLYYFYLILMLGVTTFLVYNGYKPSVMKLFQTQLPYALGYIYDFHYASVDYRHLYFLVHFWSLSVEEQFYIFWPLIIFLTPEKYRKGVLTGIIFLGPLFRILVTLAYKYSLLSFLNQTLPMAVYPLPFNHIDAFGLGAFIACYPIPKAKLQVIGLTFLLPLSAFFWQYLASGFGVSIHYASRLSIHLGIFGFELLFCHFDICGCARRFFSRSFGKQDIEIYWKDLVWSLRLPQWRNLVCKPHTRLRNWRGTRQASLSTPGIYRIFYFGGTDL
jgi:peptidoglycan/LPS O-acetylase OafA/YrhL